MRPRKSRKRIPLVIKDFAAAAEARDVITSEGDRRFAQLAIDEAFKSKPEDERPHPKVGAVVVKNGEILAQAHRGEFPKSHAEFIALEKKLIDKEITGATVYTPLEPCTFRNDPKVACALRLVERKVSRVVIGILDPNRAVLGQGWETLHEAGIETQFFPHDLMNKVTELNRNFIRAQKANRSSLNRTIKWTPNISQLTYINVPRLSQIAGLQGIQLSLDKLPKFVFLHDLGWELNKIMATTSELVNKLQLEAIPLETIKTNDNRLVGNTVSFSALFRTKHGAELYKARDKRQALALSGDPTRDPHIYWRRGSGKLVMIVDPRWVTSSTAFGQFASGQQRFAGLCSVNRVEKGLILASPLILGTPKGPWDDIFNDE